MGPSGRRLAFYFFPPVESSNRGLTSVFSKAFDKVAARTSTWPFVAILEGRQQLPKDYWREFARAPYLAVTCFTLGAYIFHPIMQSAAFRLNW